MERSGKLTGEWREVPGFSLANLRGYEGPQCYLLAPAAGQPAVWCLILDHYSRGAGYQPFVTQDLARGQFTPGTGFNFPFRFRHGSIVRISGIEYQRMELAYSKPKS